MNGQTKVTLRKFLLAAALWLVCLTSIFVDRAGVIIPRALPPTISQPVAWLWFVAQWAGAIVLPFWAAVVIAQHRYSR
jgi:hypothetical protein